MRYLISFAFISLITCASGFVSYKSEWKQTELGEAFFANLEGVASEKSISADSVSMKQRSCIDATKTLSTSTKVSKLLINAEGQNLEEHELKDLSKLIFSYQITPVLIECQPGKSESLFGGINWTTCQCLYSYKYPGGRKQFQNDLIKVK
ncbi:MAG: hypothetical protein SH817_08770 [Leptospira sp.]|nr:hypothetical protein [Leptospira sp.]